VVHNEEGVIGGCSEGVVKTAGVSEKKLMNTKEKNL
jgi:hypothetical protein